MIVAICDANQDHVLSLGETLRTISATIQIEIEIDSYSSGKQLLFELDDMKDQPDIIYLAAQLPDINGIEIARRLRDHHCESEIIFTSVNPTPEMIVSAFDVQAFHFLILGETPHERFEEIFVRAYEKCSRKTRETLIFSCAGENRKVFVEDILYFEARDHYITVHYGNKKFEFYSTFGKIDNVLQDKEFMRVHRSFIVSLNKIVHLNKDSVELENGSILPVGRTYMSSVRDAFHTSKSI